MAYSDKVIDHYENPRNVGNFGTQKDKEQAPTSASGIVGAPECGDVMQLQIKVDEDSGKIEDAKFKCFGCGSAIASSSLATEWLKGKTVDEGWRSRTPRSSRSSASRRSRSTAPCSPRTRSARRSRTTRRRATPTEALARVSCPAEFASSDFASSDQPAGKRRMTEANDKTEAATVDSVVPRGIHLTEKAAGEVKRVIAEEKLPAETALRVGCKGGGCSGFSYVLDFDQTGGTEFDLSFDMHGVKVVIDKKSEFFMAGTTIDFSDENLLNRGFTFTNPKASGSCGCGTSFQV
jgi:iron-sulfur cluster assembly accessory protein